MLKEVFIHNFSLIEKAELVFDDGLNIVTGETGAGKSILIGALSMLLGERASTEQIRTGSDKAIIEGIFKIGAKDTIRQILSAQAIDLMEDILVVRRELSAKGQNRCFLNDALVPLGTLKEVGNELADLHGQHEHQSLLRSDIHLDLLDAFAELDNQRREVANLFTEATRHDDALRDLVTNRQKYAEQNDLFHHQLKELDEIAPDLGEDDKLLTEERLNANSEQLYELANRAYEAVYDREDSVLRALSSIQPLLNGIVSMDPSVADWKEQTANTIIVLQELARELGEYRNRTHFDPERLDQIRERLLQLQRLKKKYGSIQDAINKRQELHRLISVNENFESEILQRRKLLFTESALLMTVASELSDKRHEYARHFDRKVVAEMKKLGMENARFETTLKPIASGRQLMLNDNEFVSVQKSGIDEAEFLLSANLGEEPRPLVKIASGGEISRIMLAIKTVMTKADRIPTLVFDEIDVGISGRIAQVVGRSLHDLARRRQVLCITHLPQIACMSQSHYAVMKSSASGKTITEIRKLSDEEKLFEVAKLLSGDKVTPAVLDNARELLAAAHGMV